MTIITDPSFYAIAIPAVIALGLAKGGFAGVGQMATPMLALIMPPLEAAAIMLPILIMQDANAVWFYRKEWSGRIVSIFVPGSIIGICLAWWLASYISDAAARLFIGAITIAFVLYAIVKALRVPTDPPQPGVASGVFWGVVSGFTSTICQAGGPPYQIYTMRLKMPKMLFVGTTAVTFAFVNLLKVIPYLALGTFSAKGFGTTLILMPLALAANYLGFWLVRITPQELFYRIAYVLMTLISIELIRQGALELWFR